MYLEDNNLGTHHLPPTGRVTFPMKTYGQTVAKPRGSPQVFMGALGDRGQAPQKQTGSPGNSLRLHNRCVGRVGSTN